MKNIIPEEWSNIWDGPELPNSYLKSLGKKIKGMGNYIRNVNEDKLLQNCDINLSEFLHPEAFINALRQKTAREKKIPGAMAKVFNIKYIQVNIVKAQEISTMSEEEEDMK